MKIELEVDSLGEVNGWHMFAINELGASPGCIYLRNPPKYVLSPGRQYEGVVGRSLANDVIVDLLKYEALASFHVIVSGTIVSSLDLPASHIHRLTLDALLPLLPREVGETDRGLLQELINDAQEWAEDERRRGV